MKKGKPTIKPHNYLIGINNAYRDSISNIIYVSPAIYELIQDEQVKDDVINQMKLFDISLFTDHLIQDFVNRGAREITRTGITTN